MGADVRNLPAEAAAALPYKLRQAGIQAEVSNWENPQHPAVKGILLSCRQKDHELIVGLAPDASRPGEWRVVIPNKSGRLYELQMAVTAVIEQSGGYWPFAE